MGVERTGFQDQLRKRNIFASSSSPSAQVLQGNKESILSLAGGPDRPHGSFKYLHVMRLSVLCAGHIKFPNQHKISNKNLLDRISNDLFWSRSRVKKCTTSTAQILLSRVKIKIVPFFKYSWFILDSTLNYNEHVSYLITTVQHKILMLGKENISGGHKSLQV